MKDARYPIGVYTKPKKITFELIAQNIEILAKFPQLLREEVKNISEAQLASPYREGGWNIAQVVHHCADSHMNAYIRTKWTLTESAPIIKAYTEDKWATLPDSGPLFPIEISLQLLESLHQRWVFLFRNISTEDWNKYFQHPENGKLIDLCELSCLYAWHCQHHLAHIQLVTQK